MPFRSLIEDAGTPKHAIAVIGDGGPGPLAGLLEETFETQSIDVRTDEELRSVPEALTALESDDVAVLLEDGTPVAASPMTALYESILAINSDLFVTGARGLGEIELPDVLAGLEGTRLRLRGYPLAHKEKLLLILVSRYIEQRAWAAGRGTLHSGFQQLSRLDDEIGTREVYAELSATDVDVHLYGVDDTDVPAADTGGPVDLDATVHVGSDEPYRDGWFVVYEPDDRAGAERDASPAALVCLETESRVWDGFWTTDPERVATIETAIARELS